MKKKFILFILMVLYFQYGYSKIDMKKYQEARKNIVKSNPSIEESYEKLVNSDHIGYDFNDIYLGIILKEKNSEELLRKLYNEANNNTGKIFALIGLYKLNRKEYENLKKKLSGDVMIDEGCYSLPQNAQEYLQNYENSIKDSIPQYK